MRPILKPGQNCWNIFDTWETGILIDTRAYFQAFYHTAKQARHYILLAGWQFDSGVYLLRGEDKKNVDGKIQFLPFLNSLCLNNPDLKIYILAWDFAFVFTFSREWFQKWIFNWNSSKNLYFRFDSAHPIGASHHQKFVVIDGVIAFVGGIDISFNRWDDVDHLTKNPYRKNIEGISYEPYHDIQAYGTGPIANYLADFFKIRWKLSGGGKINLPPPYKENKFKIETGITIFSQKIAVSRTQAESLVPPILASVNEIRNLYIDAIEASEEIIYIENQYFSSHAVYQALINRMRTKNRPSLQIVIILPRGLHTTSEIISIGSTQANMLHCLTEVASRYRHSLGIYYTESRGVKKVPVYIHAKLLLIDDIFLSVGSANINNRSMGLDTEMNMNWEVTSKNNLTFINSIKNCRVNLLAEHTNIKNVTELSRLGQIKGLVAYLDQIADSRKYSLRHHSTKAYDNDIRCPDGIEPKLILLDPKEPVVDENIYELMSRDKNSFFVKGITLLSELLEKF
ncbi:MAG: phospholipase D-like domain-containing protein [bacterium]